MFPHRDKSAKYGICNDYSNVDAVDKVISYILRPDKRMKEDGSMGEYNIFGSIGVYNKSVSGIIDDFKKLKRIYGKTEGVQIKHIFISFSGKPEITKKKLRKLIIRVLKYFGRNYQLVYAVHENTDNLHFHIGINTVAFNGKKFNFRNDDREEFEKMVKKIFDDYI